MRKDRTGKYSQGKAPILECQAYKDDDYNTFAKLAARVCKLDECIAGQKLALFKIGGVQIMNEDGMVKQEKRKWNIVRILFYFCWYVCVHIYIIFACLGKINCIS